MPLKDLSEGPRTTNAPVPGEEECSSMFEKYLANHENDPKNKLSQDEQQKLRSSFKDPKFREMLADYMEEISDPKYREETEQYISQMEADDQVPSGKELVRPEPGFVVKTHMVPLTEKDNKEFKGDKIFVNIVQSPQIAKPIGHAVKGGTQWSLPISLGPKRFEADKGEALVPTFDACFHPDALKMVRDNKVFRDYVVHTALEQVQASVNTVTKSTDVVRREYHVLRGVSYKNGKPAIMMMTSDKMSDVKSKMKSKPSTNSTQTTAAEGTSSSSSPPTTTNSTQDSNSSSSSNKKKKKNKNKGSAQDQPAGEPVVKKGFLNSGSSAPHATTSTSIPKGPSLIAELKSGDGSSFKSSTNTATSFPPSAPKTSSSEMVRPSLQSPSKVKEDVSALGVITPTYHMKERGSYRLSDSMNTRVVQPSRPTELDIIIELPALASKSDMDLDVSTDKLKFTAVRNGQNSSYKLELKLPYPCDGGKGKAKFDKTKKELKVTIPVIAPKFVEQQDVIGSRDSKSPISEVPSRITSASNHNASAPPNKATDTVNNDNENENINDDDNDDDGTRKLTEKEVKALGRANMVKQQKAKTKEAKVDHSKWVQPAESNRMTFDLPEGAKLVAPSPPPNSSSNKQEKGKYSNKDSSTTVSDNKIVNEKASTSDGKETTVLASALASPKPVPSTFKATSTFTKSDKFMGYVPGYVFKLGDEGIGYYSECEDMAVEDIIAPYDFKQRSEVLTILVQVPQINAESVSMTYSDEKNKVFLSFYLKQTKEEVSPSEGSNTTIDNKTDTSQDNRVGARYTLILKVFGALNTDKCRFDVADKNMIVVLYKAKEEFWESPILSVQATEYQQVFPPLPVVQHRSKTFSQNGHEDMTNDGSSQLADSLDSIERAAAKNSLASDRKAPPSALIGSRQSRTPAGSSASSPNDVVAPTPFQNTIMFELD